MIIISEARSHTHKVRLLCVTIFRNFICKYNVITWKTALGWPLFNTILQENAICLHVSQRANRIRYEVSRLSFYQLWWLLADFRYLHPTSRQFPESSVVKHVVIPWVRLSSDLQTVLSVFVFVVSSPGTPHEQSGAREEFYSCVNIGRS